MLIVELLGGCPGASTAQAFSSTTAVFDLVARVDFDEDGVVRVSAFKDEEKGEFGDGVFCRVGDGELPWQVRDEAWILR